MECVIGLVLSNDDLLSSIFQLGRLTPIELIAVERVSVQWRRVYHTNARALVRTATPPVVTKTIFGAIRAEQQ